MILKIFENDLLLCELDDEMPVLRHRWKNEPSAGEFQSNLLKVLSEYETLKKSYVKLAWLADTTFLGELDEETEAWLENIWEDLLFRKANVKIHAVVLGDNIFADYPMEQFKNGAEEKFRQFDVRLGVFSNIKDAYAWITDQQIIMQERQ